jgi:two-component system phosphate regulon sensor histidine kinase PhoR
VKKRLILMNAAVITLGFIAAFLCAAFQIQRQFQNGFTDQLDAALAILSTETDWISGNPDAAVTRVSEELAKTGQQMRISVIDPSGKVVGDSSDEEIDQNHLDRPEIRQALKEGRGYDTRMSASVHEPYYYEAVYLPGKGFLRAALPTSELDRAIRRLWLIAALSMLLGIAAVCAVTAYLVWRVTEPLGKLTDAAKRISGGDYSCRVDGAYRDEVGELARSFNVMAESTEAAVSELRSKQDQLEGVLEGMGDGVIAADGEKRILFLNGSACRLLGKDRLHSGGKLEGSLLIGAVADRMEEAALSGKPIRRNIEGEGGSQFTVYAAPVAGQGSRASLAVITDVTRLKKLERLRSEFVANVTHELKTPLTSIRGSIDLLKSADRDEKTRRYFYDVLDIEAERLQHLIEDMLVLSQIENARDDPSARPCGVAEALSECVKRLKPVADKNGISVKLEADAGLYVSCSPTRLQQLFGNLIENAIKYNVPQGSVLVTAVSQRKTAVVRVKDTGIGIAPEHFDRLFERFYRVDASRSREIGGTGLGLSIVKHLANLYGGEVGVESRPGKGSTFTVRLPLVPTGK